MALLPLKPKPSKSFLAVNCFLYHHAYACGMEPRNAHHSTQQKLALQTWIFRFRQTHGVVQEYFVNLVHFAYLHNPTHVKDLREYGNAELMHQVIRPFRQWLTNEAELVRSKGMLRAIRQTVPTRTDADDFLADMMDDLLEETR